MENKNVTSRYVLPSDSVQPLIELAKDWILSNGVGMRSKCRNSSDCIDFIPFTLFPSNFPKSEYEKVVNLQLIINELIHNVAHDNKFLRNTLKNTVESDDFTRNLFHIYDIVFKEGIAQSYCLGLLRSDYMLDDKNEKLSVKQVEINTISCSFGGLSQKISLFHRFILERQKWFDKIKELPENLCLNGMGEGLTEAWKFYGSPEAVIIVVVEDIVYNICDQRNIEFEIYKINPEISVRRRTLTDLSLTAELDDNKQLFVDNKEVAVVYYRTGYVPNQYKGQNEWDVRLLIERSKAIKCPSIQYHLAGTKKIQQALTDECILKKFLNSPAKVQAVLNVFTNMYSLDNNDEGDAAFEMALKNPLNFVLKPQREGGGNNVYGEDITKVLNELGKSNERQAWILMDLIQAPTQLNYIIYPGSKNFSSIPVILELGIFGIILGDKNKIILNKQSGHLLRAKEYSHLEGGIVSGNGSLDSPLLT